MEQNNLTDDRIRKFECPAGKDQVFFWDKGKTGTPHLAVRVTSARVKSFVFQGKLDGETIRYTIGKVKDWLLEKARIEARQLQTLLDQGVDPREQIKARRANKKAQKESAANAENYTLKALLESYAEYLEARDKAKSAKNARSVVKVHIIEANPTLSKQPASEVTSKELAEAIRKVRDMGKERSAGILRATLKAAYNCGVKADYDTGLPGKFISFGISHNPVDPIPSIAVRARSRTLSNDELRQYIAGLGESTLDLALKLSLFAGGQRMAQVLRVEDADWNPTTQTLRLLDTKGNRKQPREHFVPLAPMAAKIVKTLLERIAGRETRYLFPSATLVTPIHESQTGHSVSKISTIIGGDRFDVRDIRRTCETRLAELGISQGIRAQLLSHGLSGVQQVHYDKHDYVREKHTALIRWEQYLRQIQSGKPETKVVQLRKEKSA